MTPAHWQVQAEPSRWRLHLDTHWEAGNIVSVLVLQKTGTALALAVIGSAGASADSGPGDTAEIMMPLSTVLYNSMSPSRNQRPL